MTAAIADDFEPRSSRLVKADLTRYRAELSDAAEAGDHDAYNDALGNMRLTEVELRDAITWEAEQKARRAAADRFKAETGFKTAGELLADRFSRNGRDIERVAHADLNAAVAEATLAPKPTAADLATKALMRARDAADAARNRLDGPA